MNVSIADRPTVCHRWVKSGLLAKQMMQRAIDLGWQPLGVFPDPEMPGRLSVLAIAPEGANFEDFDGVAQMEEQPASNRQAAGSSPAIITGRPGPHGASGAGSKSHSAMLVWMQLPDDRKWAAAEVEHGRYTGPYDTKAKALKEHPGAKVVARIAATADPVHVLMSALDIRDLACVASEVICDEFGAEDPEVDIGADDLSELEDLVRPVLTDWVTRHDVKTAYFKIDRHMRRIRAGQAQVGSA